MTMHPIQLTAKLLDNRDQLRSLWGDAYAKKMVELAAIIRRMAAAWKIAEASAAIRMASESNDDPLMQMAILAAMVEMVEPSPGVIIQ